MNWTDEALERDEVIPPIAGVRWDCRRPTQPPSALERMMERWFNDPEAQASMQRILDRKAAQK